jgi:hypothetical protein
MAGRAVRPAIAVGELRVAEAVDTIRRPAAVDITPEVGAGVPTAEAAEADPLAAVADTRVVVAVTPAAEAMVAAAIAKKLGDGMSLREAATCCSEVVVSVSEETEAGRACETARPLCFFKRSSRLDNAAL